MQKGRSNLPRKLFIETSAFIRFFTRDDPKKSAEVRHVLEVVEVGSVKPYTSNVVILEIVFVLTRLYGFTREEVVSAAHTVLNMRNMTLVEKTNTEEALRLWRLHGIKYGDCLIATQVPHNVPLVTYDKDFKKFPELAVVTPDEIS